MKVLKLLGSLLFFIFLVTAVLSLVLPANQKITRSVNIQATSAEIFDKLSRLEHFKKVAIWNQEDSSALFTTTGPDGTVGATTSWKGHPMISGEGSIRIAGLIPNRKVEHDIVFISPKKGQAKSIFEIDEVNPGVSEVTWTFNMATPRPWNIFNLFYSMDEEKGSEFEKGLDVLKKLVENR